MFDEIADDMIDSNVMLYTKSTFWTQGAQFGFKNTFLIGDSVTT